MLVKKQQASNHILAKFAFLHIYNSSSHVDCLFFAVLLCDFLFFMLVADSSSISFVD